MDEPTIGLWVFAIVMILALIAGCIIATDFDQIIKNLLEK
jgi:outer membrane murein-binding lipoprotein Lpp